MYSGIENPNSNWTESKGFYLFYLIFVTVFHLILLSFLSVPLSWTFTNITHNLAQLYFLHIIKGTPWIDCSLTTTSRETHWEQLSNGEQWSNQRKTLFIIPLLLFLLTALYTKNNEYYFIVNFISLVVVIIPKFPQFHHRRIFNINKY